jgi:L-lactate dehydrogenase (cytochrome)
MDTYMNKPVTALDYRRIARKRLPRFLFDYIDGGSNEEDTLAANVSDFRRFNLKQRVMRNVENVDTSTVMSGQSASMPLVLGPVGIAGAMARRGEVQAARGASASGIPFTTSTLGICPLEEIKAATDSPFWFQLYMLRDRDIVVSMLERAVTAGCKTLVFTVDLAVPGMRHRDSRNPIVSGGLAGKFAKSWQIATRPRWAVDVGLKGGPLVLGNLRDVVSDSNNLNDYQDFVTAQIDQSVTWEDIAWLRSLWKGKLLIKGVMTQSDARAAADVGADGVVVSNHGGRQLDSVSSSILKLPKIVSSVGDRIEVYMDGGVRSGIDVVKALALGANGVLIGRPWVWAMAGRGQQGLTDLLGVFQQEITVAMALMGVRKIADITPDLID